MGKSRILITGATGFVGSNLARKLCKTSDVHIIARSGSNQWRLKGITSEITIHEASLTDENALKEIAKTAKPDVIYHLATTGLYGGQHPDDKEVINTSFLGSVKLMNAFAKTGFKCFVNTGSSSEYGIKKSPMKETDSCNPINTYGVSKLASTLYASNFAEKNSLPIVNVRLFSPFGPYDHPLRLISYASLNAVKGKDLELSDPNSVRDYIHVDDVVDFYMRLGNLGGKLKGETLNLGSGQEMEISYVVGKILEFSNSKSKVLWQKAQKRDFDTEHWQSDMAKSKKLVRGFKITDFDKSLKKAVEWFRENYGLYDGLKI